MFCVHCGKELPDEARFCPECGNAVQSFIREEPTDGSLDTKSQPEQSALETDGPADEENLQDEADTETEYPEDEESGEPDLEDYSEENEEENETGVDTDDWTPFGDDGRQLSSLHRNSGKVIGIGIVAVILAIIIGETAENSV